MTADTLALFSGSVLSLLFSYVPGLNDWFEKLEVVHKRLVMLGLLVITSVVVVVLACAGLGADLGLEITCDRAGVVGVLRALILAVMANQSTYKITPRV